MNTKTRPRPVPRATRTTAPFWEGAKAGKLMLQYDPEAGKYQFWPRAISVRTGKMNLEWREASGRGTVYSCTVTHVPTAGFEERVPYTVGLIELEEGVRIIANIVNIAPEEVKIGMPVKVTWETLSDEVRYFAFEPA